MSKNILFISHEASRTGAPMLLLNFLKWLKANTGIPFKILLRRGGELEPEFKAIAPTMVLARQATPMRLPARILRRLKILWYAGLFRNNTGLIYSNTADNGDLLESLSTLGCPVISHIHELEHSIMERGGLKKVKRYTGRYIACSEAVTSNLIDNHGIPASKIETIHEFISFSKKAPQLSRSRILGQLGIPDEAPIVCASGTTCWRKSPEIFIQLARSVNRKLEKPAYFIWVGDTGNELNFYRLMYDVKRLGLEGQVRFVGVKSDPYDYFAACDVFVQVSREDPYPIVCLEAALFAKPIVCFDKAGGTKEFVEDDAGFVVPYLDVEAFASKVVELINSPQLRERLGRRSEEKVRERHGIETSARRILQVIKTLNG